MSLATDLASLPTPALLLSRERLEANVRNMAARHPGLRLRPHFKTARAAEVADLLAANGAMGFAVSTLAEAAFLAEHGHRDLLPAVGARPPAVDPRLGYGLVCDLGGEPLPGVRVFALSQEHGWLDRISGSELPWERLAIGSRVRILPGHACITAGGHAGYFVLGADRVEGFWQRVSGW
jgi:D-serine deaminase-like pyridoxal phosphate-dependent protein